MHFKIVKIDRRFRGSDNFDYRLEFVTYTASQYRSPHDRFANYQLMREWFWENYGPSSERDTYGTIYMPVIESSKSVARKPPKWAWHYDTTDNEPFIYVADDATLAHLQLKWSA